MPVLHLANSYSLAGAAGQEEQQREVIVTCQMPHGCDGAERLLT